MQATPIHAQVLKRFQGGRTFEPGEIIDPSGWPPNRLKQMLRFRYVQLVSPTADPAAGSPSDAVNPPRRRRGRPRKIEVDHGS